MAFSAGIDRGNFAEAVGLAFRGRRLQRFQGADGEVEMMLGLPEEELNQIALYLNFDMIGSPNHVFFIYDGDDSDGVGAGPGPEGSAQIEQTFEAFYTEAGLPFKGTDFSGRSDYGPFIAVGIPSGGLFTGAEGIHQLGGGVESYKHDFPGHAPFLKRAEAAERR